MKKIYILLLLATISLSLFCQQDGTLVNDSTTKDLPILKTVNRVINQIKKAHAECLSTWGFSVKTWYYVYCNTKLIGIVNRTFTDFPRCFPGDHFGEDITTRMASLFREGSAPLTITASSTFPFLLTTN